MTATNTSSAEKLGKFLKSRVRQRSDVLAVWARQVGEIVDLCLVTDAASIDDERELHDLNLEISHTFPNVHFDLRVFDVKLMSEEAIREHLPNDAFNVEI